MQKTASGSLRGLVNIERFCGFDLFVFCLRSICFLSFIIDKLCVVWVVFENH